MGGTLLLVAAAWVISPIVLGIMLLFAKKQQKDDKALIQKLYQENNELYHQIHPDAEDRIVSLPPAGAPMQLPAAPAAVSPDLQPAVSSASPADSRVLLQKPEAPAVMPAEPEQTGEITVPAADVPAQTGGIALPAEDAPELFGEVTVHPAETPAQTDEIPLPAAEVSPHTVELPAREFAEAAAAMESHNAPEIQVASPISQPVAAASANLPESRNIAPVQTAVKPAQSGFNVSAITVMLSVGVTLIIVAGLLFVRSAWHNLSDIGKLATLASGCGIFFGASALADRVWHLKRTGTAFFTIGAAFLPISVWAAGYMNLLGDGLSGASNPLLLALAAGSFTVVALIGVKFYQQLGWGIASLIGLTVAYVSFCWNFSGDEKDTAWVLLLYAVYALAFAFGMRILRQKQILPAAIGRAAEPFAIVLACLTGFFLILFIEEFEAQPAQTVYAAALFLTAFAFFAPAVTERFKGFSAIPTTALSIAGFGMLLQPLYDTVFVRRLTGVDYVYHLSSIYTATLLVICAMLWLILLLTRSLPDLTRKGYLRAAYVLSAGSILLKLFDLFDMHGGLILVPVMTLMMTACWILLTRKEASKSVKCLIAFLGKAMVCEVAVISYKLLEQMTKDAAADAFRWSEDYQFILLYIGLSLLGFGIFVLTKKYRTAVSDLLLTGLPAVAVQILFFETSVKWVYWTALLLSIGFAVLFWRLALAHNTCKWDQYLFAVMTPAVLLTGFLMFIVCVANSDVYICIWALLSLTIGAVTYFTTKKRFDPVRKLLFAITAELPILFSFFAPALGPDIWDRLFQLIGILAALGLWKLFSNRGFHKLAAASFATALINLVTATVSLVADNLYDGNLNFTACLIGSLWMIVFSVIAIVIAKRILRFVGGNSIQKVMQFAAPVSAFLLAALLSDMNHLEWDAFYFVFVFAFCVLAWFVTEKRQILLPAVCAAAFMMAVNNVFYHSLDTSNASVIFLLFCFIVMAVLFPYLGIVAREGETKPADCRRTWVLTAMGGILPFWLTVFTAGGVYDGSFTHTQEKWMEFFFPILMAGFILHFVMVPQCSKHKKTFMTIASALGVIAFWMQPAVDVRDTYLEGKLHILPLIAFGIILRRIYGESTGGKFLFGVGVYTMIRLGLQAMSTEAGEDIVTVLFVALVMFLASFYIKQKKWFLLGGISLVILAAYLHMKLTDGKQWWLYLLLAGLVLIVVAAVNETLKQRGDSLKSKAGRLWEDWSW